MCRQAKPEEINNDVTEFYLIYYSIEIMLSWFQSYNYTRAGPTPTNNSRNSEPDMLKNGTPASPAVAFASNVFPVPGGPDKIAP